VSACPAGAVEWRAECHAVLCCAVLCCAVLCCAVLCCAVLCCEIWLWLSNPPTITPPNRANQRYYWQCKEDKSVLPGAITVAPPKLQRKVSAGVKLLQPYAQCGGIVGHPDFKDAPWPAVVCPLEYECIRLDE